MQNTVHYYYLLFYCDRTHCHTIHRLDFSILFTRKHHKRKTGKMRSGLKFPSTTCFASLTKSKLPPFYMGSISFFFYQPKTDVIYNTRLMYFTCSYDVYCGKLLRQLPLSAIVMCVFFHAHSLHTATHKFHACNNTRFIRPFQICQDKPVFFLNFGLNF